MIARDKFKVGDLVVLSTKGIEQGFVHRRGTVVGFYPRRPTQVKIETKARKGHKGGVGSWDMSFWDRVLESADELPEGFGDL